MRVTKKIFGFKESGLILIIGFILLLMYIIFPNFRSINNMFAILYSVSINTIIIGAVTVLFISGEFDLSVGAMLGFSGIVCGVLIIKLNFPIIIGIIITLLIAASIGGFYGYLISYLKMNTFMVTLALWFILDSLKLVVSPVNMIGFPESFTKITTFRILGIPMIIIIAIILLIIFDLLIRKNIYFRQYLYIGGNYEAARIAGVKVKLLKLNMFIITAVFAAFAGILLASRYDAGYIDSGGDTTFLIITAVIIGGGSLKGGRGSALGSFLGLILLALFNYTIILFRVDVLWTKVITGALLIIAVIIDTIVRKEKINL